MLHASFKRSVTLTPLRFTSLAVVSLGEDLHLQVGAHAGHTKEGTDIRLDSVPSLYDSQNLIQCSSFHENRFRSYVNLTCYHVRKQCQTVFFEKVDELLFDVDLSIDSLGFGV